MTPAAVSRRQPVVVVDPDAGFRSKVRESLLRWHGYTKADVIEAERMGGAQVVLSGRNAQDGAVLVIGPGQPTQRSLRAATQIQQEFPGVGVVLVAAQVTATVQQAGMRAGVREIVAVNATKKQFREAVANASDVAAQAAAGREAPAAPADLGRVITVFSSKGGVGKSVVASNLAVSLAESTKEDVVLVDLNLESGDLPIMLGLDPSRSIYDATVNIDKLDVEGLERYTVHYREHLALLAAPPEPGYAEKVPADAVRRVLHMLRQRYRYVVVDGASSFTEQMLAAIDESDELVLVASMDLPTIKNLKLALGTLDALKLSSRPVKIVLNRADAKVGMSVRDVERSIRRKVDVLVPSSRDVTASLNRAEPLALSSPRSDVSAALAKLATGVSGVEVARRQGSRLFAFRHAAATA